MAWKKALQQQGYVQIKHFLPVKEANRLRNAVIKQGHFKAWDLLTTPSYPLSAIKDNISNAGLDKWRHKQALQAFARRQFSFSFYRSNNKHDGQHHNSEICRQFNERLLEFVTQPLNLTGKLQDSFFASFIKDQFINYHSDGSAGQYGYIFQLSKGWQHQYGGQLELYPRKIKFYKRSFLPLFNSLVLLKLDHPMYHSVRKLNNPAHKHRITLSGWLE